MEWVRKLVAREADRPKGLNSEELASALTRWREDNPYAWWLNDNLDAVSRAVQQQMGLIRETRVAVAVQLKKDVSAGDKPRLVDGFDSLLELLDSAAACVPLERKLWPGHAPSLFLEALDNLEEGTLQAKTDLLSGRVASAHEGFKAAVEEWLFASVPLRYRLNAYMRETLPPAVLASLPPTMLPVEPPKELARYAQDRL